MFNFPFISLVELLIGLLFHWFFVCADISKFTGDSMLILDPCALMRLIYDQLFRIF